MPAVRFIVPLTGDLHPLQAFRGRGQQPARHFLLERLQALVAGLLAGKGLRLLTAFTHGDLELLGQLAARAVFRVLRGQRAALAAEIKRLRIAAALTVDPVGPAAVFVGRAGAGGGEQAKQYRDVTFHQYRLPRVE